VAFLYRLCGTHIVSIHTRFFLVHCLLESLRFSSYFCSRSLFLFFCSFESSLLAYFLYFQPLISRFNSLYYIVHHGCYAWFDQFYWRDSSWYVFICFYRRCRCRCRFLFLYVVCFMGTCIVSCIWTMEWLLCSVCSG
jgi:hypothetical protein